MTAEHVRRAIGYGLAAAALAAAMAIAAAVRRTDTGYVTAVFSPDGTSVVALGRDVRATVVGLGFQGFTPPADVWVHADTFSLQRITFPSGRTDVLQRFPPSPLQGLHLDQYRGSLFTVPHGRLRWLDGGRLAYELVVTRPGEPSGTNYVLRSEWNPTPGARAADPRWERGSGTLGSDDDAVLSGARELILPRGREGVPCGIVVYEAAARRFWFLAGEDACAAAADAPVSLDTIASLSRRADIERLQTIRRTYDMLVQAGIARGQTDGDARLSAIREMQRLGYYPRPATYTARLVPADEVGARRLAGTLAPLFDIAETEFEVGLFPDIQAALEAPGEPVETSIGKYIVHDDFTTSARLNALLESGGRTFFVRRGSRLFELTLHPGGL